MNDATLFVGAGVEGKTYHGVATLLTCDPLKRSLKFGVYQESLGVIEKYLAGPEFLSASWQRDTLAGAFCGVTESLLE